MKLFLRGLIYGLAFVASYVVTYTVGADLFAKLGDFVHVGRALFSFTVSWALRPAGSSPVSHSCPFVFIRGSIELFRLSSTLRPIPPPD